MRNRKSLRPGLTLLLVLVVSLAIGQTLATDKFGAVCDETWDLPGSPYVVTGDVTVAAGCALDVDAGVTVRFQGSTGLIIDGDLTVAGVSGSAVAFTSDAATPAPGDWDALAIRSGGTADISWADIGWAVKGVDAASATVMISDTTIHDSSSAGLQSSGGTLDLARTALVDNGSYGLYATGGSVFVVDDVAVSGSSRGLYLDGAASGTVAGLDAQSNTYGLSVYANNLGVTTVDLTASSLTDNSYGVYVQGVNSAAWFNPVVTVSGSTLRNNSSFDYYAFSFYQPESSTLSAGGNWWGSSEASAIGAKVFDHKNSVGSPIVDWCEYLDGPLPGGTLAHNAICPSLTACDATVTWNEISQPYLLTSTMTICPTGTLDIGPGVEVHSIAVGQNTIAVQGTLNVNGTSVDPVTITSNALAPAAGDWAGVRFEAGSSGSMAWADIGWAVKGVDAASATVMISDTTIHDSSSAGLQSSGGTLDLARAALVDNGSYGLYATGGSVFVVDDVDVSGCSRGLYLDGAASGTVAGLDAQSNTYGLSVYANNLGVTTVDVTASSLTDNSYGVYVQGVNSAAWFNPVVTVSGSTLRNNSSFDYYAFSFYQPESSTLSAGGNWWGSSEASAIGAKVFDHKNSVGSPIVDWCEYLDGPLPGGTLAHNAICPSLTACDATVTWNETSQPYLLTSTMTICPTGTLDIGPGVEVHSIAVGQNTIAVQGTLNVNGTSVDPVTITSNALAPAAGDWAGVRFEAGSSGSMAWADIGWAVKGVDAASATVMISDTTIHDSSSAGLQSSGGTLDLARAALVDNGSYGLYATGGSVFVVDDVDVSGCSRGLYLDGAASGTVAGLDAQSNTYGLSVYANNLGVTTVDLTASSLTDNSYGVYVQGVNSAAWFNPVVTVSGSTLRNNSSFDYYAFSFYQPESSTLSAGGNWWGSSEASAIGAKVFDHKNSVGSPIVDWCEYLDGPLPGGTLAHNAICPSLTACDATVTWNETSQPYLLTSTMTICPTGTLDIGPGVEVHSIAVGQNTIAVQGTLNVNGTSVDPVTITSNALAPAAGDWAGVRFEAGSSGSMAWADIGWAVKGVDAASATVMISDTTIHDSSSAGLQSSGGTLDLARAALVDNGSYGLYATGGSVFVVEDVAVSGSSRGLYLDGAASGTVAGLDARSNTYGLSVYANNLGVTTVDVTASSLTDNSYGVYVQGVNSAAWFNPAVTVSGSTLRDNSSFDYYAFSFHEPESSVLWAPDNWWGTSVAEQIAMAIFDREDNVSSPLVVTRVFGSSCEASIGRNSDFDMFGDFEDNCPVDTNPDQADMDGDGMGDTCDPQPNTPPANACDGIGDASDGFADADADGWGDPCDFQPVRGDSFPGAQELCDGRDNDGDALFAGDELADLDGDGAVACADCNDDNVDVFPCACERCANLVDDDCDGGTDGDDATCAENPYCVLLTSGSDPLLLLMDKGPCGGANVSGPYDVIRGFTTNLGLAGKSVDLGPVVCTSAGLGLDRVTDLSEDSNPACNDGSVFWLARPDVGMDFGTSSEGQPRDVSSPDPACP